MVTKSLKFWIPKYMCTLCSKGIISDSLLSKYMHHPSPFCKRTSPGCAKNELLISCEHCDLTVMVLVNDILDFRKQFFF